MKDTPLKIALCDNVSYRIPIKYLEKAFSMLLLKYSRADLMIISSDVNHFELLQGYDADSLGLAHELETATPFSMLLFTSVSKTIHKPFLQNTLFSKRWHGLHFLQKRLITSSLAYWFHAPVHQLDQQKSFMEKYVKDNIYALVAFPCEHTHTFYMPLYFWDKMEDYKYWKHLSTSSLSSEDVDQRKFCCWYCANLLYPENIHLHKYLNRYKRIHVYGHPAIATHHSDWISFQTEERLSDSEASKLFALYKQYRFVLCAENTRCKGVISSHLAIALAAGAVPLYYGASDVGKYFSTDRFIDYDRIGGTRKAFRDALISADQRPENYKNILRQPIFTKENISVHDKLEEDLNTYMQKFSQKIKDYKSKHNSE